MIALLVAAVLMPPQADFPLRALGIGYVQTVEGKQMRIASNSAKGTVLFFISVDCPIANRFAPEIARIAAEFSKKGFEFARVYPDATAKAEAVTKHGKDYSLAGIPAIIDANHYIVNKVRPKVTPEAAVVGKDGRLLYRGRIDDSYMDHGRYTANPSRRDLREALADILSGRAVRLKSVPAVGCDISELN
ncbi:MAG: redoxin domain-containing protein [Armatimonadota bacterium]|nr:redoxin domain-containing protein [Armatimonadota bacterium]